MLRLRTTTSLSLLALAVGIAGTQWLSGQGIDWTGPSERVAGYLRSAPALAPPPPAARHLRHERYERPALVARRVETNFTVVAPVRRRLPPVVAEASAAEPAPPPELVPVAMPSAPVSWSRMRDHLAGNVLLDLVVDGAGNVTAASLARSSGDPMLDAHALATVRGWRFAVPADHPDGLSGELTMRFAPTGTALARLSD